MKRKEAQPRNRRTEHKLRKRRLTETGTTEKKSKAPRYRDRHDWSCGGVLVSDHAVVRYLEHVLGIDIRRIREAIISEGRGELAKELLTCKIPMPCGARLVVVDGVVKTILRPRGKGDGNKKGK